MAELTIQSGAMIPAQDLTAAMFDSFVKWIDRSDNTTRSYIINLRQFAAWLNYTDIRRPVREDIISYRQYLCAEHEAIQLDPVNGWKYRTDKSGNHIKVICKPGTVKEYLRSVCQFFKWTAASGIYPNIADNIHAPKVNAEAHKKEALTAAQVLTIEENITARAADRTEAARAAKKDTAGRIERSTEQGKRLYAMYLLSVNAGLRCIELHRANIKDLEVKDGQAYLYIWGKGHFEADQKKPIAQEVYKAIQDYISSRTDNPRGSSPLFVSTGNRSYGKRIAATTISTMLKQALKDAGYNSDKLTAHSLRHTAGTSAMKITDKNIYLAQQYMRHADPKTTEIYIHDDTEQATQADLAERLYNFYHGEQSGSSLNDTISVLTPAQLQQLSVIAAAMARA